MRIWLIRHGLTRLGEEKRYQGALDEGLSDQGHAELKRADFLPPRVYVSPMLRARETAAILFPGAERIVVPDLREMDFGTFEGRGWWEMEQDAAYRAWVDGGCLGSCPGGEDREGFSRRVCNAMEALLQTGEDLVIVAHNGGPAANGGGPRDRRPRRHADGGAGALGEARAGVLPLADVLRLRFSAFL